MNIRQTVKGLGRTLFFLNIGSLQLKIAFGSFFFLWLLLIFRISQFPIQEGYWVASSNDDFANLYRQSQMLSFPSSRPQIILLASSSIREALQHPESFLPRIKELPRSPDLRLLTAGDLNQLEMAQILTLLPRDMKGVLFLEFSERLLGLTPDVLQQQVSKSRLPYAPFRYQKFLLSQGLRPPIFPNYPAFYAARMQTSWTNLAPQEKWNFHQVGLSEKHPPSDYPRLAKNIIKWTELSVENAHWNQEFFRQLIQLSPPKMKIIFILPPRNPDIESLVQESEIFLQHQENFQEIVASFDIPVVSIHQNIPAQDYVDHGHIWSEKAREQCTQEFLHHIKKAMVRK